MTEAEPSLWDKIKLVASSGKGAAKGAVKGLSEAIEKKKDFKAKYKSKNPEKSNKEVKEATKKAIKTKDILGKNIGTNVINEFYKQAHKQGVESTKNVSTSKYKETLLDKVKNYASDTKNKVKLHLALKKLDKHLREHGI